MDRNNLVIQFLPLAYKIACQMYAHIEDVRRIGTMEDAQQTAILGLINAAEKYDPNHPSHAKFITYATWAIRNVLLRTGETAGVIRVPAHVQRHIRTGANPRMAADGKRAKGCKILNPNAPVLRELYDRPASCTDYYEHALVRRALRKLPRRSREIVLAYHSGRNYSQIADAEGITRQRVQQIVSDAHEDLREILAPALQD